MKIPPLTPEQAAAILKFCQEVQRACPWANICPLPEPVNPVEAVFGKNPFGEL